jgi:hypothetical protein
LVVRQLEAIRREPGAAREAHELFANGRRSFATALGSLDDEVRGIHNDIHAIRSDILTLENQNLNRHTEILDILERLRTIETL